MNAPTPPPFADATDEALSALLDGELATFAAERGLTEREARARLEAWPEFAARRAVLARSRDALGAPVSPLDELARRQLVRGALAAVPHERARMQRRTEAWAWLGAAAATAFLVLGIGVLVSSRGTESTTPKSATGGTAKSAANAPRGDLGQLGDVSNPAVLRALLDREIASSTLNPQADRAPSLQRGSPSSAPQASATATADCSARPFRAHPVLFHASATYHGEPAIVIGIEDRGRIVALVVRADDCATVLTSLSR